jgi:hypothetical protein
MLVGLAWVKHSLAGVLEANGVAPYAELESYYLPPKFSPFRTANAA